MAATMIPKSLGWLGKQVRSADGRPGSITGFAREAPEFIHGDV